MGVLLTAKLPDKEEYTYSLVELFTYLNKSNVANGTGASRIFKTAYSPDYNRLIMKIIPKIVKGRSISDKRIETFINKSQFILDLALVDYTIKKDEVLQRATITIRRNARGIRKVNENNLQYPT